MIHAVITKPAASDTRPSWPNDVARLVVFLCTDSAAMINGHDVPLDGGQLAKL